MDNQDISKWGHPDSDQGGQVDVLLLKGLTEDEIIKAFAKNYPDHENPRGRVLRHLRHLEKGHKVNLYQYFGKGINIIPATIFYLPTKADVEFAESQLRKSTDDVTGIENVLDQVEANLKIVGKPLKENWRQITRRNIELWFGKEKQ